MGAQFTCGHLISQTTPGLAFGDGFLDAFEDDLRVGPGVGAYIGLDFARRTDRTACRSNSGCGGHRDCGQCTVQYDLV